MQQTIALKKIPSDISSIFTSNGLPEQNRFITLESDKTKGGALNKAYIALGSEKILIVQEKTKTCTEYIIKNTEQIRTELFISGGRVVCEYCGETTELFAFSGSLKHDANIFVNAITERKEKGTFDYEKLKNESEENNFCPKCHMRYPDSNRKVCPKCMEKSKLMKRLLEMFWHYKLYISMIIFTFIMVSLLTVLTPYVSNKVFYDNVLTKGGSMYGEILKMVLLIIGVRLISLFISMINGIISAKVAAEVVFDLKKTIFDSLGGLSLRFFTSRQTGGLMTQINSDATRIYWFFCDGFPYLVTNIIQIVIVFIVMFLANPLLTLYTFITIPIFFFSYKLCFLLFGKLHAKSYSKRRSFNSLISDVLNGMRLVKSFAREDKEMERFEKRSKEQTEAQAEVDITAQKIFRMLSFFMRIGSYVVWGVGGYQVMKHNGEMSYGMLMTFIAYLNLIYGPIDFLADVSNWWSECLNALNRLFEVKDSVPEVREKENPIVLPNVQGTVEFCDVEFSYEENRKVINDISFAVEAGHTIGIVGHSGAGKSTLANLLTRLYDPDKGKILIDHVDIRDLSFSVLRDTIAIVSQEIYLFRGTVMENIRYAKQDATIEEIITAAKIASAHDFIMKYPDAYETMVGLGYKDLSGGEKQRISIARAVLKNPRILILDEATAAMDTQTEFQIQEALDRLTENRTTIMIAHRLSTLRNADKLIVIEDGKMPEQGTIAELLKKKGVYYKLYKMQAEALKSIGIEE